MSADLRVGIRQPDTDDAPDETMRISRRGFVKLSALASALALPISALVGCSNNSPSPEHAFFDAKEYDFIDAATRRLIPTDALGPGAHEAAVANFIDLQLAGPYGRAERWYMRGPWPPGTDQQGFQLRYTPAQIYRAAIAGIDAHCHQRYGKPFTQLAEAQLDEVLHALEDGTIKLSMVPAKSFFALLLQNTQEGFLADPVYGGNQDFAGWKLIGFPGPRYNYTEEIEQFGRPYTQPFVSLVGREPSLLVYGEHGAGGRTRGET